jgi:quinol monooxygenase YgiN
MIQTFVTFRVLPGRTEEFEAIHRELLAQMCAMPGCLEVDVHRSAADPIEYMVHGRWASKAAWERAHQTSPDFRRLFARLPLEGHSVSRGSFFERVYSFAGSANRSGTSDVGGLDTSESVTR